MGGRVVLGVVTAAVTILLFATARDAVGSARLRRPVPVTGCPLREVVDGLADEFPRLRPVLRSSRLYVNRRPADGPGATVRPRDEIAIHPPYSGG